jgi:hypothetical protein
MPPSRRTEERCRLTPSILDAFKAWLDREDFIVLPQPHRRGHRLHPEPIGALAPSGRGGPECRVSLALPATAGPAGGVVLRISSMIGQKRP